MTFLTIEQFKTATGVASFTRVFNPISGKWFLKTTTGETFKCQQDLDVSAPLSFIFDEEEGEDATQACLINVTSQWEEHETW
jgi:hypothetical protein